MCIVTHPTIAQTRNFVISVACTWVWYALLKFASVIIAIRKKYRPMNKTVCGICTFQVLSIHFGLFLLHIYIIVVTGSLCTTLLWIVV